MIYYHFKSKDDILRVLIDHFLEEYMQLVQVAKNDTHMDKSENMTDRLQNHYYEFAIKNVDLIRIIFIESLKKNTKNPPIFNVVETMIQNDGENIKSSTNYDRNERLVAEFFSGIVPLFSYLCFHMSWCDFFKMDRKEFNTLFLKHFAEIHGTYHKNNQ